MWCAKLMVVLLFELLATKLCKINVACVRVLAEVATKRIVDCSRDLLETNGSKL